MKKVLFLLLIPCYLFANNKPEYAVILINPDLMEDANAVIRHHTTEFSVSSPSTAILKERMIVTRLNEDAGYEKLYINYSNHIKINSISANIYDALGKLIRKVKKNEIEDMGTYDGYTVAQDNRNKYIDFSYGNYPYTIEYEYEQAYKEIIFYPSWSVQNFKTSVEFSQYILKTPSTIEVKHKLHNLDIQPDQTVANGQTLSHWKTTNVPAVRYESRMPEPRKKLASGYFAPNLFEIEGHQGDMHSWESIGMFFYKLNENRDQLSPKMIAKVHKITQDATTDEEKIDLLYRYMQENMRYVSIQLGIGGWQTFDAKYVETNKFGDCKALSNFMKAMLKVIDIKAYTALVFGGNQVAYQVEEDFARPMFNHVILHIPSSNYWLECTSTDNPPNHLGTFTEDRNVLLVTEEGGKLVRTPKPSTATNFERHHTYIKLGEDGQAQLKDKVQIGGLDYDYYQGLITENNSEAEQRKRFLEDSGLPLSQLNELEIQLEQEKPQGIVSYELDIAHYASRSGKRLFVPVNLNNAYTSIPTADDTRSNAVLVQHNYIEQDTIHIQLPETASIESLPKSVAIQSDYGNYQLNFEAQKNKVVCIRSLTILSLEIPAEQYNDWRNFCKKVARKDKAKIVALIE